MRKFFITESEKRSIRKMYGLNEQESYTRNLPTIDFEEAFPNNMVELSIAGARDNALNQLNNELRQAIERREIIDQISITVRAGHSPERATNRLPQGINSPDHDYDGLQGMTMEVCPTGQRNLGNNQLCWIKYGDRQWENGYTPITDGNVYLARKRGENLKSFLLQYLREQYPNIENINIVVDDQIGTDRKFVNAIINSSVSKKTEQLKKYNFYIEDIATQEDGIWYVPVSPVLVGWAKSKPTSIDDAKSKMEQVIKDRKVLVKNYPYAEGSQYEENFGLLKPYVEIKNYTTVGDNNSGSIINLGDGQVDIAKTFWYKDYETFNQEVKNLAKYNTAPPNRTENVAKTYGAAGFLERMPPPPKQSDTGTIR